MPALPSKCDSSMSLLAANACPGLGSARAAAPPPMPDGPTGPAHKAVNPATTAAVNVTGSEGAQPGGGPAELPASAAASIPSSTYLLGGLKPLAQLPKWARRLLHLKEPSVPVTAADAVGQPQATPTAPTATSKLADPASADSSAPPTPPYTEPGREKETPPPPLVPSACTSTRTLGNLVPTVPGCSDISAKSASGTNMLTMQAAWRAIGSTLEGGVFHPTAALHLQHQQGTSSVASSGSMLSCWQAVDDDGTGSRTSQSGDHLDDRSLNAMLRTRTLSR